MTNSTNYLCLRGKGVVPWYSWRVVVGTCCSYRLGRLVGCPSGECRVLWLIGASCRNAIMTHIGWTWGWLVWIDTSLIERIVFALGLWDGTTKSLLEFLMVGGFMIPASATKLQEKLLRLPLLVVEELYWNNINNIIKFFGFLCIIVIFGIFVYNWYFLDFYANKIMKKINM